jgi:hypothetical protein
MQRPTGRTILTAHRHYGELFAPTTAGACLRQMTQPTWSSPTRQATKESDLANRLSECHQHSTGTQSTLQRRPPRYRNPKDLHQMDLPPANPNGHRIFSKGFLHSRERICRYRTSHDIPLSRNSGMPESEHK